MSRRSLPLVTLLLGAFLLLSACGSASPGAPGADPSGGARTTVRTTPTTPTTQPPPTTTATPGAGVAVSAHLCAEASPRRRGRLPDRRWTGLAWCTSVGGATPPPPRVVHADVSALVAALDRPVGRNTSAPVPGRAATPCRLVAASTFWLLDDHDLAYLPLVSADPCGQPTPAVADALTALLGYDSLGG